MMTTINQLLIDPVTMPAVCVIGAIVGAALFASFMSKF